MSRPCSPADSHKDSHGVCQEVRGVSSATSSNCTSSVDSGFPASSAALSASVQERLLVKESTPVSTSSSPEQARFLGISTSNWGEPRPPSSASNPSASSPLLISQVPVDLVCSILCLAFVWIVLLFLFSFVSFLFSFFRLFIR